jgi:hypothetical protein
MKEGDAGRGWNQQLGVVGGRRKEETREKGREEGDRARVSDSK